MQKLVITLVSLLGLTACFNVKRDTDKKSNTIKPKIVDVLEDLASKPLDSDADGISDIDEVKKGLDSHISNFPRIKVSQSFASVISGYNKKEFLKDSGRIYFDVKNFQHYEHHQNHIKNAIDSTFLGLIKKNGEDSTVNQQLLSTFILTDWNKTDLYKASEYFKSVSTKDDNFVFLKTRFKIYIDDVKGVTNISNISLKIGFFNSLTLEFSEIGNTILRNNLGENVEFNLDGKNSKYVSAAHYNISVGWIDIAQIRKLVNNDLQLAIRINDFDYKILDKKLKYSSTLSNVESETSLFIISNPKEIKSFYLAGEDIKTRLNKEYYTFRASQDDRIDAINIKDTKFTNNINFYDYDFSKLNYQDFTKGSWLYFPNDLTNSEKLKKGQLYIVHYGRLENIYRSQRVVKTYQNENSNDSQSVFNIKNIKIGDEYKIETSVKLKSPVVLSSNISVPVSYLYTEEYKCQTVGPTMDKERICRYRDARSKNFCTMSYQNISYQIKNAINIKPAPYYKYFDISLINKSKVNRIKFYTNGKYGSYVSGNKTTSFIKITKENFKSADNLELVISSNPTGQRNISYGANGWVSCNLTSERVFSCDHGTYCSRHNKVLEDIPLLNIKVTRVGVER